MDALVVTASIWFLGKFLRYAFPPLFETLGATYGVSRTALGAAFTGFMLVYAAMQFPSGLLADRFGPVSVIAGGGLVTAAGALALVVDLPFALLVGAMVVMGAGTGTFKTVSVGLLGRVYPARTGRALGVFDTFGSLAGVAAPAAVVVATGLPPLLGAPWRTLFLAGGFAGLVLVAAFVRRVPRRLREGTTDAAEGRTDDGCEGRTDDAGEGRTDDAAEDASDRSGDRAGDSPVDGGAGTVDAGEGTAPGDLVTADGDATADPAPGARRYLLLFARPRFAAFVAVTLLFGFAFTGVVAFLPLFLASEAGLSSRTANLLYGALFAASLVQVGTGEASDRVGLLPVLVVTAGVATLGLAATLALSAGGGIGAPGPRGGVLAMAAAVVTFGLGAHGFRPVRGAYFVSLLPDDVVGGGLGAVRTLLQVAAALGPAVVGYLSETAGFRPAFGLLVGAFAVATGLAFALWASER